MNWNNFNTYDLGHEKAFEVLCNQLFERYLRRNHISDLTKFRVINGAGGDGGIEAYGQLLDGMIIAVQAKWFKQSMGSSEINQIKNSIITAKNLRPNINKYIICIPHNVNSLRIGKGKEPTENHEENKINLLIEEIYSQFDDLELIWWFDNEILNEIQNNDNEGVHKYWFDKEIISLQYLKNQFDIQKRGWLDERYIAELHGKGIINKEYNTLCFLKEYRKQLIDEINGVFNEIQVCISFITKYTQSSQRETFLFFRLKVIKRNLESYSTILKEIVDAVNKGIDDYKFTNLRDIWIWSTKISLEKSKPENTQKDIHPNLIKSLDNIHKQNLIEFYKYLRNSFNQKSRLILGGQGTGKTHGLANCVDLHLTKRSPALIIQAKGALVDNWSTLLSSNLELQGWSKNEILSALETLAIANDNSIASSLPSGEESKIESTKAIICIDGIEEDIENNELWYSRIRESEELTNHYPKIRFLFSARRYFYKNEKCLKSEYHKDVFLPREGDVPVSQVASEYFRKENYNINISSPDLIKGLDSLFALRLFCEEYKNSSLNESSSIKTATNELLNLKINRLNKEYLSSIDNRKGITRNPISDTLEIISQYFYQNNEIEHNELVQILLPTIGIYLDRTEIDLLIDYLSNNGILIRIEKIYKKGVINKKKYFYLITYQSIIEHLITESVVAEIVDGTLSEIPELLHQGMVKPLDDLNSTLTTTFITPNRSSNQRIIQDIVNRTFYYTGKLIGEQKFLTKGFNQKEIFELQLEALINAPYDLAEKNKERIDKLFLGGHEDLYNVLVHLIFPSSSNSENYFGAEYLHNILYNQISAFERDQLWSGLDKYERRKFADIDNWNYNRYNIKRAFEQIDNGNYYISSFAKHNEMPLVFAWGLSTIYQELRVSLRKAICQWAIDNPQEFLLLLNKIFNCNDPQIQEDLASIMLGVASKLKDTESIKKLAKWSLDNVFSNLHKHRNVIVRQGFRSIVERANQNKLLSLSETKKSRPKKIDKIVLLDLDKEVIKSPKEEIYPIGHDLAWYVIKKAYDNFLEYPSSLAEDLKDNDCKEARHLLDQYKIKYKVRLYAYFWTMAAAIAYIKEIGFKRTSGNPMTDASHGGKSEIFTYEEKYTWLAVSYIQGYLSDYIPVKNSSDQREFIKDYTQITDIPNPAESIVDGTSTPNNYIFRNKWIIKDTLSKEFDTTPGLEAGIKKWVYEEPILKFDKWIMFDSNDFPSNDQKSKWLALHNYTALHDSRDIGFAHIDIYACLVQKDNLKALRKIILNNPDQLHYFEHIDFLHSYPNTDTYCNPTDIVWMSWIDEYNTSNTFYEAENHSEKQIFHTITNLTTNSTVEGEKYYNLPSKMVREMLNCIELSNNQLIDSAGKTKAIFHQIKDDSFHDRQDLVVVEIDAFNQQLKKNNFEIFWIVDLFKRRNPLNKTFDESIYFQKSRKYFVWLEGKKFKSIKFWDERFSNVRDKDN